MHAFETDDCRMPPEHSLEDFPPTAHKLSLAYGAGDEAAQYCGFDRLPWNPRGQWQHGWTPPEDNFHPGAVICDYGDLPKDVYHWVSRMDQQDYLRSQGFEKATAIGSCMLYVADIEVPRLPNSLLIMPARSLYVGDHSDWDFEQYKRDIEAVRDDFDHVVACIHPACMLKGQWVQEFRDLGIDIIKGAMFHGIYSLRRMKWLFSRFEYVTSNNLGTQLPYATYCGAKFSFYGNYCEVKPEHWKEADFYLQHPYLLEPKLERSRWHWIEEHYSQFIHDHPAKATEQVAWAQEQLGQANKRSPEALTELFCWPQPLEIRKVKEDPALQQSAAKSSHHFQAPERGAIKAGYPWFYELIERARSGDANAQYMLAHLFLAGTLLGRRPAEGAKWAYAAALQGCDEAQRLLASLYFEGFGVEADMQEALFWFDLSAGKGNVDALYRCYQVLSRFGGPQEQGLAKQYLDKAIRAGHQRAKTRPSGGLRIATPS